MKLKVRATAILIEQDKILLVEQQVGSKGNRNWSLPGGTLEQGETLEQCVIREVKEETGLDVVIKKLLYICDRIDNDGHVVHISFAVTKLSGEITLGSEPECDAYSIKSVCMVPIESLNDYGFSLKFRELAQTGFPGSGCYKGKIDNIGL